jgi:hypothetical protein
MKKLLDATTWTEFERAQWHRAVRYRGLELASLDRDERGLVFDAIIREATRPHSDGRSSPNRPHLPEAA